MSDLTNRDELDSDFRSAFEDFQPEVDEKIWANIERELHPARKKGPAWWQWAAAASLVVALSYLGFDRLAQNEELAESSNSVGSSQIVMQKEVDENKSTSGTQSIISVERSNSNTPETTIPVNGENPERLAQKSKSHIRTTIAPNHHENQANKKVMRKGVYAGKGPVLTFPPSKSTPIMEAADSSLDDLEVLASKPMHTIDNNSYLKEEQQQEI